MIILAADVGGTKSSLALFVFQNQRLQPLTEETYPSRDYPALEQLVEEFLARKTGELHDQRIAAACFGAACPVIDDQCEATNLPWTINVKPLRETIGTRNVTLINDLEANGYGLALLGKHELISLQDGHPQPDGHGALISAGTGLGEAFLYRQGESFVPVASEGGHSDFAPRDDLEIKLLHYLLQQFDHVSYERVLSGPGLLQIYSFLRDSGHADEPPWLARKLEQGDASGTISTLAVAGESTLCSKTLDLFVSIYGAEAGNLALTVKSLGGLFVGGGIAPKIISELRKGGFVQAFRSKGRLSSFMNSVPIRVILNPKTALLGAARRATLESQPD